METTTTTTTTQKSGRELANELREKRIAEREAKIEELKNKTK